jgi:hypothetical protein
MGKSGGGDADSTIYTNLIPTYIPGFQDWTVEYMASAASLSMSNFTPYADSTYAAQDANETDGIAAGATRGRYGSTIELDGKALLRNLYDGLKVNSNTKLAAFYSAQIEELLQEFDEDVLPQIRANFALAWGGSQHNVAEARVSEKMMGKINEIARMYYDDYTHERGLQQQAMAHATPYGLQCIRDMEMLRQAGVYVREFLQRGYDNAWEKWNDEMTFPIRNLDILGNAVRTILSTYRATTTKFYRPPQIAQIAGIAMAGLSLYSMFSGTSLSPYTNAAAGVGKAGAEAGASAYSADNMGFDRSNPELIGGGISSQIPPGIR